MSRLEDFVNKLSPDQVAMIKNDPDIQRELHKKFADEMGAVSEAVQPARDMAQGAADTVSGIGKAWNALAIPSQKSEEGLKTMAGAIPQNIGSPTGEPTGNLVRDVVAGAPRIAADTVAEVAPKFIDRTSILTAGALQGAKAFGPIVKATLKGVGAQGESLSGAAPGSLEAAYKDARTIFSKTKKDVSKMYDAAKGGETVAPELAGEASKIKFVEKAAELAKNGKLNPTEALEARKELDGIRKSVTGAFYRSTRAQLDDIAKQAFKGADAAHQRAIYGESLRKLLPQNKYGGTSGFKMGIGTALRNMGPIGRVASLSLSPALQGTAATGAGLVGRYGIAPIVGAAPTTQMGLSAALRNLGELRKKNKGGKK